MSDIKNYLNNFIDEIKLLVDNKTKKLDFDKTYRGIVRNINNEICEVEINKELFECKIRNDLQIDVDDIVLVKSINNNFSDKYVDAKLGVVGDGVSEGVDWANILYKPAEFPPSAHIQDASTIEGLSTVSTSGDYNDLLNKPTIPDINSKADKLYVDTELGKKVDKVAGKQLSTEDYSTVEKNKLAGIENNANKYTHPSTHPASIITENTSRRFVSDTEKTNWNAKWDYDESTIKAVKVDNAGNADTVNGKTVAENVPLGAKFTDTIYTHPSIHDATIIVEDESHKFVTDIEKIIWNNKQNSLGYTPTKVTIVRW